MKVFSGEPWSEYPWGMLTFTIEAHIDAATPRRDLPTLMGEMLEWAREHGDTSGGLTDRTGKVVGRWSIFESN